MPEKVYTQLALHKSSYLEGGRVLLCRNLGPGETHEKEAHSRAAGRTL